MSFLDLTCAIICYQSYALFCVDYMNLLVQFYLFHLGGLYA